MTGEELMAAGFKRFEPNRVITKYALWSYQKKIWDDRGTRYFVTVNEYEWTDTDVGFRENTFQADVYYNDGCEWFPTESAVRIEIYGSINDWTPQQLLDVAAQLWERLNPKYYELNEAPARP